MPKKSSRTSELDAEADRLYGLPLAEFTVEKTALASRLRKAGRKAEADEIARLPKPSRSAWAVNMLFRREAARMAALLAAGEQARAAQRSVVRGAAGGGDLRGAIEEANDLVAELRRRAVGILSEDGKSPGTAIVERVAADLQALAFDPAAAEDAAGGRLVGDLDPPGFEVLAGLQVAAGGKRPALVRKTPTERAPKRSSEPARRERAPAGRARGTDAAAGRREGAERTRREREEAKERVRAEREAEAERRERLKRAQAEIAAAESEAAVRRRSAERAEKSAAEAEDRAGEARRRAEAAEKSAAEARREAERLRERADAADAAVERARAELAEARGSAGERPRLRLVRR